MIVEDRSMVRKGPENEDEEARAQQFGDVVSPQKEWGWPTTLFGA